MKNCALIVGCLLLSITTIAQETTTSNTDSTRIPVSVIELEEVTPVQSYFTGKTYTLQQASIGIDTPGRLTHAKKPGDYVFSPIKDDQGKVLREGTVIAEIDPSGLISNLADAELNHRVASETFDSAKRNYERNKMLQEKRKLFSEKEFDSMKLQWFKDGLAFQAAEKSVAAAKSALSTSNIYSPISGQVVHTDTVIGMEAAGTSIDIIKMDTLGIQIPFPREIADLIGKDTVIQVYPPNSDQPVGSWLEKNPSDPNDIYAFVDNNVVSSYKLTPEQLKLPKVYTVLPAIYLFNSDARESILGDIVSPESNASPLAVPVESIRTDSKGDYILVADSQTAMNIEDGIEKEFKAKRIDIVKGNAERHYTLGYKANVTVVSLDESGSLKEGDIIIVKGDKDIKNGDTVIRDDLHWQFYPNELVKIAIPALSTTGFYVTSNAIIHQATGSNFVYIVDKNNQAKLIPVEITGISYGHYSITGEGIEEGAKVVSFDGTTTFNDLYDTAPVEIQSVESAGTRISHPRADKLLFPVDTIKSHFFNNDLDQVRAKFRLYKKHITY